MHVVKHVAYMDTVIGIVPLETGWLALGTAASTEIHRAYRTVIAQG
jgi:hypothetical protein